MLIPMHIGNTRGEKQETQPRGYNKKSRNGETNSEKTKGRNNE